MRTPRLALSIIETLVCLSVLMVVLSIALPVVLSARSTTRCAVSLANIRESARAIHQVAEARADLYPTARPGVAYHVNAAGPPVSNIPSRDIRVTPWIAAVLWPAMVRPECDWGKFLPTFNGEPLNDPSEGQFVSPYHYSNSFVADPRLWSDAQPAPPLRQPTTLVRDVPTSLVAHPSAKVLLFDLGQRWNSRPAPRVEGLPADPTPLAFADLHGEVRRISEATAAHPNRLSSQWWWSAPLHNTPLGVQGRDY